MRNQRLQEALVEYGTIEREIYVEASPDVVFDVVSSPSHVQQWWPDEANYEPVPGADGEIVFGDRNAGGAVASFTVVDADPPRLFSFRWTHPEGEPAVAGNSLLVTFELSPSRGGTLLKMTESGFREMGWEVAVLEEQYREHITGWEFYLPRLVEYLGVLDRHS
ncbi:MAG TPA: SRPBCC family protein [Aeromicrobium sp.]|nr:SRPBCC family protein [Aeromicrobium sp.]